MYDREPPPTMKQLAIRLPLHTIGAIDAAIQRLLHLATKRQEYNPIRTRSRFIRDAIDRRLKDVGRKR